MGLITTAEELAEAIVSDPERVAACLGRINRFGGQVPHCTVLNHSLSVYERVNADPHASHAARLWALLHDCHEVLTGDVVRPHVNARLRMDQEAIDAVIVRRLPGLVPQPDSIEWGRVVAADRAVGAWEVAEIERGGVFCDLVPFQIAAWAATVRELITIGGAA